MTPPSPRVTVALPVFNGERFLAEALESIVGQSFEDFELLISDNASTDATPEICRDYAERDRRIRVETLPENIGAAANFNRVVERANGTYFKWAAHDDVLAPEFLRRCVEQLEVEPDVVLATSGIEIIDEGGTRLGPCVEPLDEIGSDDANRRFANLILVDHRCIEVFGLMRTDVLRSTRLIEPYVASDRVLLAELALRGRIGKVAEPLFYSRDHSGRSVAIVDMKKRAAWFDPKAGGPVFPYWRLFAEYAKLPYRVTLDPMQRALCHLHLLRWLGANWNWARMARDVVVAVTGGTGPLRRRASSQ